MKDISADPMSGMVERRKATCISGINQYISVIDTDQVIINDSIS